MGIPLKEFVQQKLADLGRNPFEAARAGKLERNFVQDILVGRKLSVSARNLPKLAKALDTTPADIIAAALDSGAARPARRASQQGRHAGAAGREMARDVPIYGTARGAVIGKAESFMLDRDKVIDHVRRPPALLRVDDAYAVYIAGSSMAPMHSAGELRFVHPGRPNRPGDSVLVLQEIEGRLHAFIKLLVGEREDQVRVRQLEPPAEIVFERPAIVGVHHVMTVAEMFEA